MTNSKQPSQAPITALKGARKPLPLWRASLRMALVAAASLAAAALMVIGITG